MTTSNTIRLALIAAAAGILIGITSCSAFKASVTSDTSGPVTVPESTGTTSVTENGSETETETETMTETETREETTSEETTSEETVATEAETTTIKASATPKPTTKATAKGTVKNQSPKWVRSLSQAKNSKNKQLIVVAATGMNKTTATVSMHERDANGNWIQILSVNGYVGKYGLVKDSERKEGCMRTPIGAYVVDKAFGIAADPGCAIPYTKVTKDLYWSGDQRKGMHYNQMVSITDLPDLDKKNSEHLIDYKQPYQYCLNIGFNKKCTIGKGSAIFLHCNSTRKYTAGCVSVPKSSMLKIMKRVKPNCVVVINTKAKLGA